MSAPNLKTLPLEELRTLARLHFAGMADLAAEILKRQQGRKNRQNLPPQPNHVLGPSPSFA